MLSLIPSESGHITVKYRRKQLNIHQIIHRKFNGPLRGDYAVSHIGGVKTNNTPENLELIAHSENMLHCFQVLGRIPKKTRSKTTLETAKRIGKEYKVGLTNRQLRTRYGLAKATISYIVNLKTWR